MVDHSSFGFEDFAPQKKVGVGGAYSVPKEIWLEAGRLCWKNNPDRKHVTPEVQTFARFANLRDEDDESVLRFAKQWGVLELCPHNRHWLHDYPDNCELLERKGESLEAWRKYAKVATAILEISERLDNGELGKTEDWTTIAEAYYWLSTLRVPEWHLPGYRHTVSRGVKAAAQEKLRVAHLINIWLKQGQVRLFAHWSDADKSLNASLGGPGLFGVLAIQLLELAGRYVLVTCSECRKFYNPPRRPKATQNRYCPACVAAGIPLLRASHWRNLRNKKNGNKQ